MFAYKWLTPSVFEFSVYNRRSGKFLSRIEIWHLSTMENSLIFTDITHVYYILGVYCSCSFKFSLDNGSISIRDQLRAETFFFGFVRSDPLYPYSRRIIRRKNYFIFVAEPQTRVRNASVWSKGADLFKTRVICHVTESPYYSNCQSLLYGGFKDSTFYIRESCRKKESCYRRRRICQPLTDVHEEKCRQKKNKHTKPNKCNENTGKNCSRSDQ